LKSPQGIDVAYAKKNFKKKNERENYVLYMYGYRKDKSVEEATTFT
jgi:hypothetical protein